MPSIVRLHTMLMRSDTDVSDLMERFNPDSGCEWFWLDSQTGRLTGLRRPAPANTVQVVVRRASSSTAGWKLFLEGLGVPLDLTQAPDAESALVIVRTAADPVRTVLYCFGTASQVVPKDVVDGRFGLIAALNKHCGGSAIPAWRTPPANPRRRRRASDSSEAVCQLQADVRSGHRHSLVAKSPSPSPVEGLGFDTVADLLKAIQVLTEDDMMRDLDGGRGLRFSTELDGWSDLVTLAEYLVALRARTDYKRGWDWVDHIVPVAPRTEVERLHGVLYTVIAANEDADVDMVLPDLDDIDAGIGRLCFGVGREEPISAPVEWRLVRTHLLARPWSAHPLRNRLRLRAEGAPAGSHQDLDLVDLLVAEFDDGDQHYVLSDGELLRVDAGFLQRLDARLSRVPWSDFPFPPYSGGTERNYLEAAVDGSGGRLALLDQRNITLDGQTAFEPCDMISDDARLVFGKLKGRSSTFSHLCTQAEAAAALLLRHPAARDALLEKVAESSATAAVEAAATEAMVALENRRPVQVTVTLLLLGSWKRREVASLPLLSRLRLQRAADAITDLGYAFEIASPDVVLRRARPTRPRSG